MLYAVLLTLIAAAIAGILPALKVTRSVGAQLKASTAGGGGMRFGGIWTAVIVTQVALTVLLPSIAFHLRSGIKEMETLDFGFPAHEYLSLRLEMDRELVAAPARSASASRSERTGTVSC